jgi:hypothetical protein
MKYGRIAGNDSINAAIYLCFDLISEADAKAFVRKFAEQLHDQDQPLHTFRELILGAFLAANGLSPCPKASWISAIGCGKIEPSRVGACVPPHGRDSGTQAP